MISRFTLPEMAELWSDGTRFATWVRVEILASEAQARLGRVPAEAVEDMRRAPVPTLARILEIERTRDHEVLSFLAAYCEPMPDSSARWVHLGMTSYDLVDTAQGHLAARGTDLVLAAAERLRAVLADRAAEHWDTVCIGRTHGVTPSRRRSGTSWPGSPSPWTGRYAGCARPGTPSPSAPSPAPSARTR